MENFSTPKWARWNTLVIVDRAMCCVRISFYREFPAMRIWGTGMVFMLIALAMKTAVAQDPPTAMGESKAADLSKLRPVQIYLLDNLDNDAFVDELMLSGKQQSELEVALFEDQKVSEEVSLAYSKLVRSLENEGRTDEEILKILQMRRRVEGSDALEQSRIQFLNRVNEILLPQQISRLEQIVLQSELTRKMGGDQMAMLLGLIDELELTPDERQSLEKTVQSVQLEARPKFQEIRKKYVMQLYDALPPRTRDWMGLPHDAMFGVAPIADPMQRERDESGKGQGADIMRKFDGK